MCGAEGWEQIIAEISCSQMQVQFINQQRVAETQVQKHNRQKYEGGANAMCNVEFECGIATSLLRYNSTFQNVDLLDARNIESQFKKNAVKQLQKRIYATMQVSMPRL